MELDSNFYDREYFEGHSKSGYDGKYAEIEGPKQPLVANFLKSCFRGPMLDVGCAFGYLCAALQDVGVDARGIDISEYSIANALPRVKDKLSVRDITAGNQYILNQHPPFKDREFPTVVAFQTMEHIPIDRIPLVVKEMCRICDEYVVLEVPTWYDDKTPNRSDTFDKSHVSFYSASFWVDQFYAEGFFLDVNLSHKLKGTDSSRLVFYRGDNVPARLKDDFKVIRPTTEAEMKELWDDHYGVPQGYELPQPALVKVAEDKLKILVISSTVFPVPVKGYSGLEQLCYEWAVEFQKAGHKVALVAPEGSTVPEGMELITTPVMVDESQAYPLYKERLGGFSVIMDNSWLWYSVIAQMETERQLPVIHIFHSDPDYLPNPPPIKHPCIVGLSKDHARRISEKWGFEVRPNYNGVPLDFYQFDPSIQRNGRWLWCARYHPDKACLEAIHLAKKCNVPLDLYGNTLIIRDQDYLNQCMAECDANDVVFHLEVPREETVKLYQSHKALIHLVNYCIPSGNLVFSNPGVKDISELEIGEKVLGHDGKLHPIIRTMNRDFNGDLVKITPFSFNIPTTLTPEHPVQIVRPRKCAWADFTCQPTCHTCKDLDSERIYRQSLYERVLQLAKEGKPLNQIVRETGVAETTAYYWISGRMHPRAPTERPFYKSYKPAWCKAGDVQEDDFLVFAIPDSRDVQEIDLTSYSSGVLSDGLIYPQRDNLPDKRASINPLPTKLPVTDALLKLCGFYAAEGCLLTNGLRFNFGNHEGNLAKEASNLIQQTFGMEAHIVPTEHALLVDAYSVLLPQIFESWFGNHAENKHIPTWIYLLPAEKSKAFIEGIWRGDGSRTKRGKYEVFEYRTVSPHLGIGLWNILLKQGIVASIRKFKQGKEAFGYKDLYGISINGDAALKFAKLVNEPFNDVRQPKHWKGFSFIYDGKVFLRVRRIARVPFSGKVYNFEVEDSNSYICQGVPCHNCEAFGLVPVEAMACGMPVIVNRRGALPELVEDGVTGFVVDTVEQAEEVIKSGKVDSISPEACRKRAEMFSIEASARGYLELFREVASGRVW